MREDKWIYCKVLLIQLFLTLDDTFTLAFSALLLFELGNDDVCEPLVQRNVLLPLKWCDELDNDKIVDDFKLIFNI